LTSLNLSIVDHSNSRLVKCNELCTYCTVSTTAWNICDWIYVWFWPQCTFAFGFNCARSECILCWVICVNSWHYHALSSVSASVRIVSTLDKTAAVISVMLNMKFEHNYDGHSKNKLQNGLISSLDTFQVKGLRRRFNSSAHTKRITVHSSFWDNFVVNDFIFLADKWRNH